MPELSRRSALALGAAALTSACIFSRGGGLPAGTRLVLVRHMDRDGEDLNDAGRARADALPGAIADIPLDAIYTHALQRNQDSAAPLAAARGIEVSLIERETVVDSLPGLAAGRSVIWVGNSDNIVDIWQDLRLPGASPSAYGEIAIVDYGPDGAVTVDRRNFAAAT